MTSQKRCEYVHVFATVFF